MTSILRGPLPEFVRESVETGVQSFDELQLSAKTLMATAGDVAPRVLASAMGKLSNQTEMAVMHLGAAGPYFAHRPRLVEDIAAGSLAHEAFEGASWLRRMASSLTDLGWSAYGPKASTMAADVQPIAQTVGFHASEMSAHLRKILAADDQLAGVGASLRTVAG